MVIAPLKCFYIHIICSYNMVTNIIKNDIDISQIVRDINSLFSDANIDIKNMLAKQNIITREKILTFSDSLIYKFLCAYKNNTNQQIASDLNYNNNIHIYESNYYKKEQKVPLQYYQNVLNKTKMLFDKYKNNHNDYNIVAVDGTYNNTNLKRNKTLETSLNMGYYDVTNEIPIDIKLRGTVINKEISSLIDYINNSNIDTQKVIFVMDRGYFSYDLFNFLKEKHIKFVIRVKNNCLCLKNKKLKDIRFVSYNAEVTEIKKDKNNNDKKLVRKLACHMATNLDTTYNDETIRNIYKSRWDIEVFFKLVKSNFKFSYLTEHNKRTNECYAKTYTIIIIYFLLEKLFESIIIKPKQDNKYNIKYNKTLALNGIKQLIPHIIRTDLTINMVLNYIKAYFKKVMCEKNKLNPRISKRPFTKWYIKYYSDYYKYAKIIDCIENNKLDSLNKNLKLEASNIKIS